MSAKALEHLRSLWGKLRFAYVDRVVARIPEDVLSVEIQKFITTLEGVVVFNGVEYHIQSRNPTDIPREDRWRSRVAWHNYFGFTRENIYFNREGYHELDLNIDLTLDFSAYGNHTVDRDKKPHRGDLICGVVSQGKKGLRFDHWFLCSPELERLIRWVNHGLPADQQEAGDRAAFASQLITTGYPDQLWAIGRLFFFDNVVPFVKPYLTNEREPHPLFGQEYGPTPPRGNRRRVDHGSMWISPDKAGFVRVLSDQFNEPAWVEQFQRLRGCDLPDSGLVP